jgi:hypothetical protein
MVDSIYKHKTGKSSYGALPFEVRHHPTHMQLQLQRQVQLQLASCPLGMQIQMQLQPPNPNANSTDNLKFGLFDDVVRSQRSDSSILSEIPSFSGSERGRCNGPYPQQHQHNV